MSERLSETMQRESDAARKRFKRGEGEYYDGRCDGVSMFIDRVAELERSLDQLRAWLAVVAWLRNSAAMRHGDTIAALADQVAPGWRTDETR